MERSGAVSVLSGVETEPVGPKKGRGQPELGRSPALTGGYRFNWAFVCQQPALALLSWAWVPRTRSAGQDKGPTGREKPT